MQNWLKKSWKKVLAWFFPVVLAASIGATQLPTSFDLTGYNYREFECWKSEQMFLDEGINRADIPTNKTYFSHIREIKGVELLTTEATCTGYLIEVAHPMKADNGTEAMKEAKKMSNGASRIYNGNTEEYKIYGGKLIAINNSWISTALAAVPVADFEDGSDGADVYGTSGGTGWSSGWGTGGGACSTAYDFTTTTPHAGTLAVKATSPSGTPICSRPFSAVTTDGSELEVSMRSPVNNARVFSYFSNASEVNYIILSATGQIQILDDVTTRNLVAYSADTWYTVTARVTFSTEKVEYKVSGGATVNYGDAPCNPNCNLGLSSSSNWTTGAVMWTFNSADDVNGAEWDDIGPAAAVAGGSVKPPEAQLWD